MHIPPKYDALRDEYIPYLHKFLVMHNGLLILVTAIGFQTYTTLSYVRPYSQADSNGKYIFFVRNPENP